ncbi:MAG: DUF2330 domain-containing protein [Pseudomonadota bacterium]
MRNWMKRLPRGASRALAAAALAGAAVAGSAPAADAFCGFFVAKADGQLFNEASKVVMARDGSRTVLTMVNDYQGDPTDFAMVIPTPTVLSRDQINVGETSVIDHLDAYSAPRVVKYDDPNPCGPPEKRLFERNLVSSVQPRDEAGAARRAALGVTVEAEYTVGEYDILILSAAESGGLQTWLDENGYRTPEAARDVLGSYIRQGMKFFVARVNLAEQAKRGGAYLRPLQIAFESEKFMLPIRLGTVNAKGKQDLLLFTLTRTGRVELANYRTLRIPSDVSVPLYVQTAFGDFYKAMFDTALEKSGGKAAFTEYAWDMNWCDPCAADPLTVSQLRSLGVFWLKPEPVDAQGAPRPSGGAVDVFVTRLHLRYDAETHPEDLRLTETGDRQNFQGRYVTRHPYVGAASCEEGRAYRARLGKRFREEAQTLASLTGWPMEEIRARMAETGQSLEGLPEPKPFWIELWKEPLGE